MAQSRRDSCWRSLSPSSNNLGHEVKYLQTVESMTQASVHLSWPKDLRQRRRRMLSKWNSLEEHCSLQGKRHTHSGRVGPEDPSHPFPRLDRDLRGAQPWMNTKHCGRPVGPLLPGTPGSPFGPCSPCEKSRRRNPLPRASKMDQQEMSRLLTESEKWLTFDPGRPISP